MPVMVIIVALTSLQAARAQMAVSLGFHIVFAALAVGLPAMLLFAE
jgi:cytochrome d ubiquinol oxidase subunit I